MDIDIRALWAAWRASGALVDLLKLIFALLRAGSFEEAFALIAENAALLEGDAALESALPGITRLLDLLRRIGISESSIEWLQRHWKFREVAEVRRRLIALRRALERLLQQNPGLRPLHEFLERLMQGPRWFADKIKYAPETALGPIGIGLAEVLFIFAAGLLLPASKMGDLTLDDDTDRDKWLALITQLYRQHVKDRAEFREGTSKKTRTQLLEDADYLWKLVQAFLRRYPDSDQAAILRMIERAAGGWVRQYLGWDEDTLQPAPAPQPSSVAPPALPPQIPVTEHPHTVERPQTYEEWLAAQKKADAQRIRDRIIEVRKRLRELKRKRQDPNYEHVAGMLDEYIKQLIDELEKLRARLKEMGSDDTGEEFDEPYDPPPAAPLPPWPLGHNWQNPVRLYVNPKSGEQRWFSDPPPGGDWERMDGTDGEPQFHWGWVPEVDPETGKIDWKAGWLPGPPTVPPYQGTLALPK